MKTGIGCGTVLLSGCVFLIGCGAGNMAVTSTPTPGPTPTPTPAPTPSVACTTANATITHTSTAVSAAQIVYLDTSKYPQAVCNDGSSAAYVLRPGTGAAATRWIISLQGGNECGDQPTCSARAANSPQLISTVPDQGNAGPLQLSGIQASDPTVNPDFYDATQVHPLYCSSDDWSGVKTGSGAFSASDVTTWNFQGRAILSSIIADVTAAHGFSNATEVLFTGDSAGGVGAFVNVNDVAKLVPTTARFVASSDAGFGNVVENFSASGSPPDYTDPSGTPAEIAKRLPAIALWNGHGDTMCSAAATTPTQQVDCYSGQQLLAPGGGITLPMLVAEAQKDTSQLGTDGIAMPGNPSGYTTAESGYADYFATQMRTNLAITNANVSLFSPDATIHEQQNIDTFFLAPYTFPSAPSLTLQQSEGAWYRSPCTPQRNIAN